MLALAGLAAAALGASPAAAQQCGNQSGNSEVDQYSEFVPGACGDKPSGSGGGSESNAIPQSVVDELGSLGPDGAAAAALAQANAPRGSGAGDSGRASAGGGSDSSDGSSGAGAIVDALGGDGDGLGFLLPLILALVAAAGIAYVVGRRRGSQTA
jgi:hypothetical protein